MTQITAVNSTDQSADLAISRGDGGKAQVLSGRIALAAQGVVIIPPVKSYTIQASAVLREETYFTSTLRLPNGAQRVTARVEEGGGEFEFQLVADPGGAPEMLTLANTLSTPATFTVNAHAADEPDQVILASQLVVAPLDVLEISVANAYAVFATVDGLVTNTVEADPERPSQDVTVQIVDTATDGGAPAYGVVLLEPAVAGD